MTSEHPTQKADRIGGRRFVVPALVILLLGHMAVLMVLSSEDDAPTFDEPAHVAGAIGYTHEHDLAWNFEHPPLLKLVAGLPLRIADIRLPGETAEHHTHFAYGWGRQILYSSGNDPDFVMAVARLPMVALTLVVGLIVFGFARDLFGAAAALIPLALYTVCVDVLAHGRLVTTDVGASGLFVLAIWLLWRAVYRRRGWVVAAGVAYGLALSSKFSVLIYAPLFALMVLVAMQRTTSDPSRVRRAARSSALTAGVLAISIATVWLVYLAIDPGLRFPRTLPEPAASAEGTLVTIADSLPLPRPYRAGLRYVIGTDDQEKIAFINGDLYHGGRLSYFPLSLSMKTPLGILVLWAWAQSVIIRKRRWDAASLLAIPALVVLLVGMTSDLNIGVRHVMPLALLLTVSTGVVASSGIGRRTVVVVVLTTWAAVSSWLAYPHYLSYVNEAWGGPRRAYELVTDSNVDWGQDLKRLGRYLDVHARSSRVYLGYFGTAAPTAYGIHATDLATVDDLSLLQDCVIAVSVSFYNTDPERYAALGEPDDQVGHSILIFRRA